MSRFGWTIAFLLAFSAVSASGTVVPACTVAGDSLSFALSTTSGNSYTCGDKIFSGFTNPNGVSGTVSLTELNADQYKLSFIASGGGITTSFSFGFTVAIAPGFPTWNISQIQASMLTAMAVGGGASIPNASTGTLSLSSGAFSPTVIDALSSPGQNSVANVFATTEIVGFVYNPTGSPGVGAGKFVSVDYIVNQTQAPEPATFYFLGAGLLALAVIRRRIQT